MNERNDRSKCAKTLKDHNIQLLEQKCSGGRNWFTTTTVGRNKFRPWNEILSMI